MRYILAIPFIAIGATVGLILSPLIFGIQCGIEGGNKFFDFPKKLRSGRCIGF